MASNSTNVNASANSSNNTKSSTEQASRSSTTTINSLSNTNEEISKAEHELYDRQIRLWGLEAQNR